MATMRPIPYPTSRHADPGLFAGLEAKGGSIGTSHPIGFRSLFGVDICDMGWTEALAFVETISNLRHSPRTVSFVDGRTALLLSMSGQARAVLTSRILLPVDSRIVALAARVQGDGPLKASFDAAAFADALLTFMPRLHVALVGAKTARLETARERFAQHAPWHAFSTVRAADLGSGVALAGMTPGIVETVPDLVIVDAHGYGEELRFEQALSLRHNGLIIMAGAAFDSRNS